MFYVGTLPVAGAAPGLAEGQHNSFTALLVYALLRIAHPNTQLLQFRPAFFSLGGFYMRFLFLVAGFLFSSFSFSADYYWEGPNSSRFPSISAACAAGLSNIIATNSTAGFTWEFSHYSPYTVFQGKCNFVQYSNGDHRAVGYASPWIYRRGDSCPTGTTYNVSTGECLAPPPCPGASVRDAQGMCVLTCPAGTIPDNDAMVCNSMCPAGKFWDFETDSCKYPEDELCPTGSNWNAETKDCVCDGEGILSNSMGFRICMKKADGDCTPDSPDYIGNISGTDGKTKPYCNGRARCPDGTKLGSVGKGADSTSVCIPDQGTDESCPGGQSGNLNGKHVCVPKPNQDPDCPGGQSGMVNGAKKCLPKPGDPGSCKKGETPGFSGTGSNLDPVCIADNYKPDTCPPGQYAWNVASNGFACVKLPNQPKDPIRDDPTTPDVDESKVGKEGTITSVTKDADGNTTGSSEMNIKFPEEGLEIKGLLVDEPNVDYFKDSVKFSESELDKLDDPQKEFLRDMTSGDGAFTERTKLDQLSGFMGGIFGTGQAGCTGQLVLGQHSGTNFAVSCEKLSKMKDLFAWFVYISTIFAIYGVLTRPPVS